MKKSLKKTVRTHIVHLWIGDKILVPSDIYNAFLNKNIPSDTIFNVKGYAFRKSAISSIKAIQFEKSNDYEEDKKFTEEEIKKRRLQAEKIRNELIKKNIL